MASLSSNSSYASKKYDVFISFRGADTRHNFISHLRSALSRNSIHACIDYDLNGESDDISLSLIKSVEDSYGSVIVFSENYASSKWCLRELVKILECRKQGHFVIPVFYNVDPSHVRKLTGSYREAFARHEHFSENKDMMQLWKAALTEAACISGWDSQSREFRGEDEFIQNIVNDILQKMNDVCQPSEPSFIGIDKYCQDIELLLQKLPIVGISGVSGVGKTTIAKAIFDKLFSQYDNCCFFENVMEELERNGLNYIRDTLLSTILQDENFRSSTVKTPTFKFAMRRLSRKKVLIVLDDVNSSKLLEPLQQVWNCLGVGSKVIITTRDKYVLASLTIDHEIYQVQKLDFEDSLQIFRLYAFGENHREKGYEEIEQELVHHAHDLPLNLKILGSFLRSKPKEEWENALEKLQRFPHDDIEKLLSYDGSRLHSWGKSSLSIRNIVEKQLINTTFWKFAGFVTSAAGLLCFALSLSFQRLFGKWNIWKIFLYGTVSFVITGFMLLPKNKWQCPRRKWLKVHLLSLVFVFTSLGSFIYEKVLSGKLDRLGLSSIGLFSLSSLSLSRQIDIGFEVGFTNFLLATFTGQIMQINEYFVCIPAAIYFVFAVVRLSLESHAEETATRSNQELDTKEITTRSNQAHGADKITTEHVAETSTKCNQEHVAEETATGRNQEHVAEDTAAESNQERQEHVAEETTTGSNQEHVAEQTTTGRNQEHVAEETATESNQEHVAEEIAAGSNQEHVVDIAQEATTEHVAETTVESHHFLSLRWWLHLLRYFE